MRLNLARKQAAVEPKYLPKSLTIEHLDQKGGDCETPTLITVAETVDGKATRLSFNVALSLARTAPDV